MSDLSLQTELLRIDEAYDEEIARAAHARECAAPTSIDRADFFCHLARDARAELERVSDRVRVNKLVTLAALVRDAHFRKGTRRHVACCLCDALEELEDA